MMKRNAALSSPMDRPFELFPNFTPFSLMRRFTDDMEQFFDDFNGFAMMPRFEPAFELPTMKKFQKTMWEPQIEVTRKNGDFIVKADLPGLKKADINVELTDNELVISGERTQENKKEDEGFYHSEFSYGSFYRSIPLPEGFDAETAKADFKNGVLEVIIAVPKKELLTHKVEIAEPEAMPPKVLAAAT